MISRTTPMVFAVFLIGCGTDGEGSEPTEGNSELPDRNVVMGTEPTVPGAANENGGSSDPGAPLTGAPGTSPAMFSLKTTCDAPVELGSGVPPGYTRDLSPRIVRRVAGSTPMFGWTRKPIDLASGLPPCTEIATLGTTGWSVDCAPLNADEIATSGSDVLSFVGSYIQVSRNWGTAFTAYPRVSLSSSGTSARLVMGSAGHAAIGWYDGAALHVGRLEPKATSVSELPSIPGVNPSNNDIIELSVDAVGDGFVVWKKADGTIAARGWQGSSWVGAPVTIAGTGYASKASSMVTLPIGQAWIHIDTFSERKGVTLSIANGATILSEEPGLAGTESNRMNVVASTDGEITIVAPRNAGQAKSVVAYRKLATGTWAPETVFSTVTSYYAPRPAAAIDADGVVTVVFQDADGSIAHRRAAKGNTAWTAPVVMAKSSASLAIAELASLQLAIEPATKDPIVAFDVSPSAQTTSYQARCH